MTSNTVSRQRNAREIFISRVFHYQVFRNRKGHGMMEKRKQVFEIMHMEKIVARFCLNGTATIYHENFMPYDLYLEDDDEELDTLINNIDNFNHWCACRVLSLDRTYAKDLLNSIGAAQATTDRDRAQIALSYHCVSLTDVYWVRKEWEEVTFSELNLYDNPLNKAIIELSLRGRQMTVTNKELAPDLSTKGCFPKAWIREKEGFLLLKDGGEETVKRELMASRICQCFDIKQVVYEEAFYDGQIVTKSHIITSKEYSMVSKMAFDIFAINHDLDTIEECKRIDQITYYGMNILDYLTGNTDRHPENWGFLVDNRTNLYVSLYPIMDFNQCFYSYDKIDGARCQTVRNMMSQREAAIEAVKQIGLRQIKEVPKTLFQDLPWVEEMFWNRYFELKKYI